MKNRAEILRVLEGIKARELGPPTTLDWSDPALKNMAAMLVKDGYVSGIVRHDAHGNPSAFANLVVTVSGLLLMDDLSLQREAATFKGWLRAHSSDILSGGISLIVGMFLMWVGFKAGWVK